MFESVLCGHWQVSPLAAGSASRSVCLPVHYIGLRPCSTPQFKWSATSLPWLLFLWSSCGSASTNRPSSFWLLWEFFSLSISILFMGYALWIEDFWRWEGLMACQDGPCTGRSFFPERCLPFS